MHNSRPQADRSCIPLPKVFPRSSPSERQRSKFAGLARFSPAPDRSHFIPMVGSRRHTPCLDGKRRRGAGTRPWQPVFQKRRRPGSIPWNAKGKRPPAKLFPHRLPGAKSERVASFGAESSPSGFLPAPELSESTFRLTPPRELRGPLPSAALRRGPVPFRRSARSPGTGDHGLNPAGPDRYLTNRGGRPVPLRDRRTAGLNGEGPLPVSRVCSQRPKPETGAGCLHGQ